MRICYVSTITVEQFNATRAAVGFRQIHPVQVKGEIEGSTFLLGAYDGGCIVGMARLVWDGGGGAVLHVLVIPAYREQGIEEELINQVLIFCGRS